MLNVFQLLLKETVDNKTQFNLDIKNKQQNRHPARHCNGK